MNPGTARRPFKSMTDPFVPMSVREPTATIRLPSILTASAQGRCGSPVQTFPFVRITAARMVSIAFGAAILVDRLDQIAKLGRCRARVGPAVLAIPCEQAKNEAVDLVWNSRRQLRGRVGSFVQSSGDSLRCVFAFERQGTCQQL